ncbi:hypothetical protein HDU83_000104 [Entophlyctis luteolus]|nr:hypothetical protein HDU83_000104 [Entophlyctis luteolus]
MIWSHNDTWLLSGDDSGKIKYWQSNMSHLKEFSAHKESVRDLTFSPSDTRFASCSDDGTIKIWVFAEAREERTLTGHGWDVKCIDWHPTKALLASGSKDHLVKLWDPKSGNALSTLYGHKNTILALNLFAAVAWHPFNETLFVSGGSDGAIAYWDVGTEHSVGGMDNAHDSTVFSLDFHPCGHMLASGSNDHTTRFWARNRPGDALHDRINQTRKDEEFMGIKEVSIADKKAEDFALPGLSFPGFRGGGNTRSPEKEPASKRARVDESGGSSGTQAPPALPPGAFPPGFRPPPLPPGFQFPPGMAPPAVGSAGAAAGRPPPIPPGPLPPGMRPPPGFPPPGMPLPPGMPRPPGFPPNMDPKTFMMHLAQQAIPLNKGAGSQGGEQKK